MSSRLQRTASTRATRITPPARMEMAMYVGPASGVGAAEGRSELAGETGPLACIGGRALCALLLLGSILLSRSPVRNYPPTKSTLNGRSL